MIHQVLVLRKCFFELDLRGCLGQNAGVMKKTVTAIIWATVPPMLHAQEPAAEAVIPAEEQVAAAPVAAEPCAVVLPQGAEAVASQSPAAYKGIVKIEVAVNQPDYATPWQSGNFGGGNGTGFMVSPGVFMTNAHVVANARRITVSPYGDARKYAARVKYVAHDADLALVEVTEGAEAFTAIPCLQFSDKLPRLEDEVRAIGYPIGGSRLSVTRGIVSRIDTTQYSHSKNDSHLTVQIDAAINPGNSGGPVLMEDKVVGVAFQGLMQANSTGYMIPMPVISRFLKDVEDGRYDRYVDMAVEFFPMSNPAMRRHYGLTEESPGVLVGRVCKGGTCDGVLQPGDVLLSINGIAVDRSAMIELDGERVLLEELAERSFSGDVLRMRIIRAGKEMDVEAVLKPRPAGQILSQEYDAMPRYVHFAGLVFQPLHRNVIEAHDINNIKLPVRVEEFMKEGGALKKQDMVVLTKVLKDDVNSRYNTYGTRMVLKVNGVEVKGLEHLYSLLYPADGGRPEYTVIEFEDSPRPLVIDNAVIDAANERINKRFGVPAPARLK